MDEEDDLDGFLLGGNDRYRARSCFWERSLSEPVYSVECPRESPIDYTTALRVHMALTSRTGYLPSVYVTTAAGHSEIKPVGLGEAFTETNLPRKCVFHSLESMLRWHRLQRLRFRLQ